MIVNRIWLLPKPDGEINVSDRRLILVGWTTIKHLGEKLQSVHLKKDTVERIFKQDTRERYFKKDTKERILKP